jgi:putative Mn2+ efflux pump MntP
MDLKETAGIGIALGIDCLAVSAGISTARPPGRFVITACLLFGLFQSGMAYGGMAGGSGLAGLVEPNLRFAPPVILSVIGAVMLFGRAGGVGEHGGVAGLVALVGAAVSVSLDALGAGVALGIAGQVSLSSAAVIGVISAAMSAAGFAGGGAVASRAALAEKAGGLLLIALAAVMFVTGL